MWFKNARIYRFTKPFEIDAATLEAQLATAAFKPCGPQDTERQGWTSPLGRRSETLVHAANGYLLICLRREEKLIPGAVVKELLAERLELIEAEQARKVGRKEKEELREQINLELLPKAFSRSRHTYAYLAPQDGILLVEAGSAKQAEDLTSYLRKSIGSLPVRTPAVNVAPTATFSGWVSGQSDLATDFTLGQECELKETAESAGVLRCRGLELQSEEIQAHLTNGMLVTRLALTWEDQLSFVLDEELALRRLKFGDGLKDKLDEIDSDDALARFDGAFSLMTLEIARLVPALLDALGGEDRSALVAETG